MGKHEIRLRRQRMTARGIDRFRNYNKVLERHEQTLRIKKVIKAFGFFLAILIVIMLIIFLSRWEKRYSLEQTTIKNVASRAAGYSPHYYHSLRFQLSFQSSTAFNDI